MSVWIFGYGSLIFRPGFDAVERRTGVVHGYARRFWQGSPDHRGTETRPGRVVTLVEDQESKCWGVAYRLPTEGVDEILSDLDVREQGGYSRLDLDIEPDDDGPPVRALTFVAREDNPSWLGPASDAEIAAHIATSVGPSGRNDEYVLRLARALRDHGASCTHTFAIERALLDWAKGRTPQPL